MLMRKAAWQWGFFFAFVLISCGTFHPACAANPPVVEAPVGILPDLQITCNPDSLDIIRKNFKEDIYVMATLRIGKQEWKRVRLRLRGDSSRGFPKKSLKLKIPKSKTLPFGRDDLNLNAEYSDKTYMRQYLCTRIFRDSGQPCYATEHVTVHLNGVFHGIFLLVENVDKGFLEKWSLSTKGDLFKATKDHACLSHYDNVRKFWERKWPKKDTTWTVLETLISKLNATPPANYVEMAQEVFVYDNLVNTIAVNMLIGNRSTYYHNYFMFRSPKKDQWRYLPWDMDNTFILSELDDFYQRCNASDLHWATMETNPLVARTLVTPPIFRDICARVSNIQSKWFNPDYLFPIIDSLERLLKGYIPADTVYRKQSIESWHQEIMALKDFISKRPYVLQAQFENHPTSFQLIQPTQPMRSKDALRWHPAKDPNGDPLTYRLCFSPSDKFTTQITQSFKGIQDTFLILPEGITPGKYFWKVLVSDGSREIRGFDNVSTFEFIDQ
jgi:hypothetical protein